MEHIATINVARKSVSEKIKKNGELKPENKDRPPTQKKQMLNILHFTWTLEEIVTDEKEPGDYFKISPQFLQRAEIPTLTFQVLMVWTLFASPPQNTHTLSEILTFFKPFPECGWTNSSNQDLDAQPYTVALQNFLNCPGEFILSPLKLMFPKETSPSAPNTSLAQIKAWTAVQQIWTQRENELVENFLLLYP